MQIEMWPITRPIPFARNARKITPDAISSLSALIKEYGFTTPIICDEEDVIVAGHTRLAAAQQIGMTELPVFVARGLTKAQIRGLRIADNRSQQNTKWDFEMLALELSDLKEYGFDLSLTAFEDHEIEPMLAADWSPKDILSDEDEEEPAKTDKPLDKPRIEFTNEQFEVIAQAIFKLRDIEQETNITDGRALELIAADWMTSLPTEHESA